MLSKRIYLIFKPPLEPSLRVNLARKLSAMGCERLHHCLWRVPENVTKEILHFTAGFQPILLKKMRNITPAEIDKEEGIFKLGTVILISFQIPEHLKKERVTARRNLLRTPHVKVAPSVYIFPNLKLRSYRRFENTILTPHKFLNLLNNLGLEALCVSRLQIVYPKCHERIYEKMLENQIQRYNEIIEKVRQIRKEAGEVKDIKDIKALAKRLSEVKTKYNAMKGVTFFMFNCYNMDLRQHSMRAYKMINACKNFLDRKKSE